jgi:hypothetical protein
MNRFKYRLNTTISETMQWFHDRWRVHDGLPRPSGRGWRNRTKRRVSGDLKIGFALSATNDLDDGGCRFRVGTGLLVRVGLRKKLKKLGFNFFSFVLVHQIFFFVFLRD